MESSVTSVLRKSSYVEETQYLGVDGEEKARYPVHVGGLWFPV